MSYLITFLVGGAICVVGQLLIDYTKMTPAKILVSFVVIGVILGAVGVYEPFVEFAGCGATVPLTGFGYLLSQGVEKAVEQSGFVGIFTGGFYASAGGVCASLVCGVIGAIFTKSKDQA